MTQITPPPLTQRAYEAIRRRIVTCALPPGVTVSEAMLADAHGFTLAPVRAALARLTVEGLLITRPRAGHVVAPVTVSDALEVYALRHLLQTYAAAQAAGNVHAAHLSELNRLCQAAEGDRTRFIAANATFHMAVTDAAGSPRLSRLVGDLLDLSERIHHLGLQQRNDRPLPPWREPLIAALTSNAPDAAHKIMAGHLDVVRAMALEALLHNPAVRKTQLAGASSSDSLAHTKMLSCP